MGFVQLLQLANQLILGSSDVDETKYVSKIYLQLKYLLREEENSSAAQQNTKVHPGIAKYVANLKSLHDVCLLKMMNN